MQENRGVYSPNCLYQSPNKAGMFIDQCGLLFSMSQHVLPSWNTAQSIFLLGLARAFFPLFFPLRGVWLFKFC